MSDTDDTEELLNISPDLIYPDSDFYFNNIPCFGLVDNLITQVNTLEKRVKSIESMSEPSWKSNSLDEISKFRKHESSDDFLNSASMQSTPKRLWRPLAVSSPITNSSLDGRERLLPKNLFEAERTVQTLTIEDVDNFITNLKILKHITSPTKLQNNSSNTSPDSLNFAKHSNNTAIHNNVSEKFTKHSGDMESQSTSNKCSFLGAPTPSTSCKTNESSIIQCEPSTFEKFDPSLKCSRFETLNNCKQSKSNENQGLEEVSLSYLWNREYSNSLPQKVQEEKLKRQHCEETIKVLQKQILELEEKLAVAVQVDEAKDAAILKIYDQLEAIRNESKNFEEQKINLHNEIDDLKKKLSEQSAKAEEAIAHYEMEASKALNYAHFNKDKHVALEIEMVNLKTEFEVAQNKCEQFNNKYLIELEKNKRYSALLTQKDLELEEVNMKLSDATQEAAKNNVTIDIYKNESNALKNECNQLKSKLDHENNNLSKMQKAKEELLNEINTYRKLEETLREELNQVKKEMETNKHDLKIFYQGQVELVVQNKLRDFQRQLEVAEKSLKEEFTKKELSVAKVAANRVHQISEKYTQEIELINKKHSEECKLYKLQIQKLTEDIEEMRLKLKKEQNKHLHIELELGKFMEVLKQDQSLNDTNGSTTYLNLEDMIFLKNPKSQDNHVKKS